MRRATMVFRRTFRRRGVLHTPLLHTPLLHTPLLHTPLIIPRPTSYGNFKPNGWYRDRESAKDVLYEYIKIAGWVVGL